MKGQHDSLSEVFNELVHRDVVDINVQKSYLPIGADFACFGPHRF
jgi:hypothetical protein